MKLQWFKNALIGLVGALLISATVAAQSKPCPLWVPTAPQQRAGEGLTFNSPQVAHLKKALLTVDTMIKNNPWFSKMPEARFRNQIYIGGYIGHMNSKAYVKEAWDTKCGILPRADVMELAKAGLSISFNRVGNSYTNEACPIQDEELFAFYEPKQAGTMGGYPYYVTSRTNYNVLLTADKQVPWEAVPLTVYFDFIERDFRHRVADAEEVASRFKPVHTDMAEVQKIYEEMKKTNPKAAEETLAMTKELKKGEEEINAKTRAAHKANIDLAQKALTDFQAFRKTFSARELADQAILGGGKYGLYSDEYAHDVRKLCRLKPQYAFSDKNQPKSIKIINVNFTTYSLREEWHEYVLKAVNTLNYKALEALLKK